MCVVSMIGDHYADKWDGYPWVKRTQPFRIHPLDEPYIDEGTRPSFPVSRKEFEDLKREVLEMKELLKRAKEYDERNNEPDCEIDEKMALLRRVAEAVGVNLDDVLGNPNSAA